ncbi:penicillin-binding protein 2 [Acidimangrovimonas sediminis]|uniref:penicillin-binding protein 2 n=1 Tax=Acidimangrovimonas sediminis TaxID=2056283 RepID=UPI000C80C541|nr:penicillin-binding protein 2 [Acidimangrovimonas sediminis]
MKRTPRDTDGSHRKVSRRALLMGGAQLAVVAGLGLRMRYMQVVESGKYRMLADENRINIRLIPPARGLIFDRNGILLAGNEQNYSVVIVREDAGDNVHDVLARLKDLIPITDEDVENTIKEMKRRSPFVPITVADRLSWEDLSRVAVNGPALPGISPSVGLSRHYPLDTDLAHVVGYVGPVSERDLKSLDDPDPVLQIPDFQIGKTGVEQKLEDDLRGKAGTKRIEVNAVGRVMRELDRVPPVTGRNVQLTIDAALQDYLHARLGGEAASAVVMDVTNGDLLAIGSSPSFDPNLFVRGISYKDYNALMHNDHRPLVDKSVAGTYPPGSTFKIVTGSAALHAGKLNTNETIYCPGYIELGNRRFHCWKHSGHGHLNLRGALEQSCDVFFYEVAQRVGIDAMSAMAHELGVGVRHDLPMSAIAEGLAPTKEWKRRVHKQDWLIGDTVNAAIGQGFVLASPLQLAVMAARMATGTALQPRLVRSVDSIDQPRTPAPPLGLHPFALDGIRSGLFSVVNGSHGTARTARIETDGMTMAGKTGSSQVWSITAADRARGVIKNEDLPWNRRDHGLFVAYAPYDNPRYALSVVIEHSGGSHPAALMARDIMLQTLYGGTPPLTAYPSFQRKDIEAQQNSLQLRDLAAPTTPARART